MHWQGASVNAPTGASADALEGASADALEGASVNALKGASVNASKGASVNAPKGASVNAPKGVSANALIGGSANAMTIVLESLPTSAQNCRHEFKGVITCQKRHQQHKYSMSGTGVCSVGGKNGSRHSALDMRR